MSNYGQDTLTKLLINLFDECTAEFVHLFPQEEDCTSYFREDSKMYTTCTIANSQKMSTKIKKNGTIAIVRIQVGQVSQHGKCPYSELF